MSGKKRRGGGAKLHKSDEDIMEALRAGPNFVRGKGVRTLSVKQPWAWAILHGGKDVENRSKRTKVTGAIALHASKSPPDPDAVEFLTERGLEVPDDLSLGMIIGMVEVTGCVEDADSEWAYDEQNHWLLRRPRTLRQPIAAKGAVGFWFWMPPR